MTTWKIQKNVLKRIESGLKVSTDVRYGCLVGLDCQDVMQVCGACVCTNKEPRKVFEEISRIECNICAGLSVCGVFYKTRHFSENRVKAECQKMFDYESGIYDFSDIEDFLIIPVQADCVSLDNVYQYNPETSTLSSTSADTMTDDVFEQCLLFRIQGSIPFNCDYPSNTKKCKNVIGMELKSLQEKVTLPFTAFHIHGTDVILGASEDEVCCLGDLTLDQDATAIYKCIREDKDGFSSPQSQKKSLGSSQSTIYATLLTQMTGEAAINQCISCAPLIHHDHRNFTSLSISLLVDVVAQIPKATPVGDLGRIFANGLTRQLRLFKEVLLQDITKNKVNQPRICHFHPPGLGHIVTVAYPQERSDPELESTRKQLHHTFMLPAHRPLLRRTNQHRFPEDLSSDGYLRNTHIGLAPSGVAGGTVFLVQGDYSYHHYMQDHFDDNKWGCAYRSLQTLVSWFKHQGYVEKPIPKHSDIQQALVDIGDKPSSFVNTRQWIGAAEVSYVLDHLYGVTSKIMFVSSGSELGVKGRELSIHFQTQGTPVMIGGGVLAHTILGVDFNDVTGDLKFLILDPHYTGAEDLKVIQNKGWCGWKGPEFWDQNAFYNLCMPQRPNVI